MKNRIYRLVFTVLCLIATQGDLRHGPRPFSQVQSHDR